MNLVNNKKEYVLVDENNIIIEMIKIDDKERIKSLSIYKEGYQILDKKEYMFKGLNLNRVVNDKVLSNKEAIKKGLIKLKENEVLINDSIQLIEASQKIANNEIVEKTTEEKLSDGLITAEEYNALQNKNRQNEYKEHTDGMMLDFFNTYFENHINDMTEEEKELFNKIKDEKLKIKEKYKKVNE